MRAGDSVSVHYDPMLAKLIVHAADRDGARQRMAFALRQMALLGVVSNQAFLLTLIEHDDFARAAITTGTLDQHLASYLPPPLLAASADDDAAVDDSAVVTHGSELAMLLGGCTGDAAAHCIGRRRCDDGDKSRH